MTIIIKGVKELTTNVLAYSDQTDSATGAKTRLWNKTSLIRRIVNEEKYRGMTLSMTDCSHPLQTLAPQRTIRVFLSNDLGSARGTNTFELSQSDEVEGLVTKRGSTKAISADKALELIKTGEPYQILMIQGQN